jgi:hypothetical protein
MGEIHDLYGTVSPDRYIMELDDGKILTGNPIKFDGKNHGFRLRFSLKPIHGVYLKMAIHISHSDLHLDQKRCVPDASAMPCTRALSKLFRCLFGATTPVNVHPVC